MQYTTHNLQIMAIIWDYTHNPWIIGIICGFMYKIQFQTKIFSEFCEDPRGAHQFFSNLQIIL